MAPGRLQHLTYSDTALIGASSCVDESAVGVLVELQPAPTCSLFGAVVVSVSTEYST